MYLENYDALMHLTEKEALRLAEKERLVQEALEARPQGLRYDLGHALVRLGRWLEGRPLDAADTDEKSRFN